MADILITGANRGIGREMAARLTARGDHVIACARNADAAPTGAGLTAMTLDVTDDASLNALANNMKSASLDLLICNAGAFEARGGVDDPALTRAAFEHVLAVNVTGVFLTIQACLPALRRAGTHDVLAGGHVRDPEASVGAGQEGLQQDPAALQVSCVVAGQPQYGGEHQGVGAPFVFQRPVHCGA